MTLGSLLNSDKKENRMKILEDTVVHELISIMSHEKTDPILLTSICRFALQLFKTDEVRLDEKFMEPFYRGTASLRQMIPYLGFDRYFDLIASARKYHAAKNKKHSID